LKARIYSRPALDIATKKIRSEPIPSTPPALSRGHDEQAPNISRELAIEGVDSVVQEHFPALIQAVHACLAVFGAMALAGRTLPLSLILEGSSGNGKTTVVEMMMPLPLPNSALANYAYRSDNFTPKAFVTHVANKRASELKNTDLLPRLENKVLIIKELSPLFRGREQEMQQTFSILIAVLDGKGYITDSGTQGRRGYEKPILFNWIGATTPLPLSTYRLMSQLGTRLLFCEVPRTKPTEGELLAFAKGDRPSSAQDACNSFVNIFLEDFFQAHPVGSFPMGNIVCSEPLLLRLVQLAELLAHGRAEINSEKDGTNWKPVAAMDPEGSYKIVRYFKDLAYGHALICGRSTIEPCDLALVEHIAISSIPGHLRPLIKALKSGKEVDSQMAVTLCKVSLPTARNYLHELNLLGISDLTKGSPSTNEPNCITLSKEYQWLRTEP
jgi:hypothetical protein